MPRKRLGQGDITGDARRLRALLRSTTMPSGTVDHGGLLGLADNDHPQYLLGSIFTSHLVPNAHHEPVTIAGLGLSLNDQEITLASSPSPGANPAIVATNENGETNLERFSAGVYTGGLIPDQTDTYDVGAPTALWRKLWASELESVVFAQNTVSAIGGWFMVPHGQGALAADANTTQIQIDFGQAMSVNDFVLFRGNGQVEYMKIVSLASGTTYNVTRNLDGSGANSWPAGQPYVILGNNGDGRIEFDAQTAGPQIRIIEQGTAYNFQAERVRIGQVDGWKSGVTGYGIGIGNPDGSHMYYTPTSGLVIAADGSGLTNINGGNIQTGTIAADKLNVSTLSAIAANLGTITAGSLSGVTATFGGAVILDSGGIVIKHAAQGGSYLWGESYKFRKTTADGSGLVGGLANSYTSTQVRTYVLAQFPHNPADGSSITLEANSSNQRFMTVSVYGGYMEVIGDIRANDDIRIGGGLHVGSTSTDPDPDDIHFDGNLKSMKNGTFYNVYPIKPQIPALSSTAWNGASNAKTTANNGAIDLQSVFGAPAGIKGVFVRFEAITVNAPVYTDLGSGSGPGAVPIRLNTNSQWVANSGFVPCDANGDIHFYTNGNLVAAIIYITGYPI